MHVYENDTKTSKWIDEKGNIADSSVIEYIKNLKIPPAYTKVKVFIPPKGKKLLYIGFDTADRVQMIYSKEWREKARDIKFCKLIAFGKALPAIHSKMLGYMASSKITKNKVIATVLRIISFCNFRVGQDKYVERYNHHGITTISVDHIKEIKSAATTPASFHISFTGKKGVINECVVSDVACVKALKELLEQAKTLQDSHVFVWKEGTDTVHLTALDVNNFLKTFDPSFTSKMFRIFSTNVALVDGLRDLITMPKITKKAVVALIKNIATMVHNTPAICKKEYIDQSILKLFLEHPRAWNSRFSTGDARVAFIRHLEKGVLLCKTPF